jgi:F0F1-type ATP synthase assembly protein I
MARKRLTVKELYEKMEEIHSALISTEVYHFGWWEAIAGLLVGASIGYTLARVF